jgi:hypothetical protein
VCPETGRKTIFPLEINALISALAASTRPAPLGPKTRTWIGTSLAPRTVIVQEKIKILINNYFFCLVTAPHSPDAPVARVMSCSSEILNASTAGAHRCTFAILP